MALLSPHKNICLNIKQWNLAWSLKPIKKKEQDGNWLIIFDVGQLSGWNAICLGGMSPPRGSPVHHNPSFVLTLCLQCSRDTCFSSPSTCRCSIKSLSAFTKAVLNNRWESGFLISIYHIQTLWSGRDMLSKKCFLNQNNSVTIYQDAFFFFFNSVPFRSIIGHPQWA